MLADRITWGSKLGFILAGAGSAIGLGNIWRFPYVAGENGGGTFLVVYLAIVFTVVISILIAELVIGRAAARNPVGAYAKLKGGIWPLAGYLGVAASFIILSFYGVVGGWTIAYLVRAISGSIISPESGAIFSGFISDTYEPLFYQAIFMALTTILVYRGIRDGIERGCEILLPILFLLLIGMAVYIVRLPGAAQGIEFLFIPDWSKISGSLVSDALSQAFFSVGVGIGIMITYGSYLSRKLSVPGSAAWITILDTMVAILAGLVILPAVFAFGMSPSAGPGLTFITLPSIFTEMQNIGGQYLAISFFALLIIAALTSAISILEVVVSYVIDEWHLERHDAALIIGSLIFLFGIPSSLSMGSSETLANFYGASFFDWMDHIASNIALPIGGLLAALFIGWVIPNRTLEEVTADGKSFAMYNVWLWICRIVAPVSIAWILLHTLWS
jgi:NSS family neurotransmitter:Na+ symporter